VATFALTACGDSPRAAEYEEAAIAAGEQWLAHLDVGSYAASWDNAATLFKAGITRDQWIASIENLHTQLGVPQGRELIAAKHTTSLPNAPPGDYVVIQYRVGLAQGSAVETLTMRFDADVWKASGYFIRPE
ncbi:MAG TPA: DUF4019 domain-containing protein, partial [Gammaproteobacteria bacterium]